ncbi:MAG: hypothetical protein ACM3XM_00650 [Mycobacterium leprae]
MQEPSLASGYAIADEWLVRAEPLDQIVDDLPQRRGRRVIQYENALFPGRSYSRPVGWETLSDATAIVGRGARVMSDLGMLVLLLALFVVPYGFLAWIAGQGEERS